MKYPIEYHLLKVIWHMFNGVSLLTALIFVTYIFRLIVLGHKVNNLVTFVIPLTIGVSLLFISFSYLTKGLIDKYKPT